MLIQVVGGGDHSARERRRNRGFSGFSISSEVRGLFLAINFSADWPGVLKVKPKQQAIAQQRY